jgi:hypothetical protein
VPSFDIAFGRYDSSLRDLGHVLDCRQAGRAGPELCSQQATGRSSRPRTDDAFWNVLRALRRVVHEEKLRCFSGLEDGLPAELAAGEGIRDARPAIESGSLCSRERPLVRARQVSFAGTVKWCRWPRA